MQGLAFDFRCSAVYIWPLMVCYMAIDFCFSASVYMAFDFFVVPQCMILNERLRVSP